MNEMIERLKAGSTKYVSGTVWMDSHERFEFFTDYLRAQLNTTDHVAG